MVTSTATTAARTFLRNASKLEQFRLLSSLTLRNVGAAVADTIGHTVVEDAADRRRSGRQSGGKFREFTTISGDSRPFGGDQSFTSQAGGGMAEAMRMAVFSSKRYEREFLASHPEVVNDHLQGLTMDYLVPRLGPSTAHMAAGADAVCVFVNDVADRATIDRLTDDGTRCLLLRCAGYNNVDLQAASDRNLKVFNVPAYSPNAVAEFAVALLLSAVRKTHRAYNRVRESNFTLYGLMGFDISGKTVGVVGTGKIGRIFCRIMKGFGANVLAFDQYEHPEAMEMGVEYVPLDEIYARSDVISLHCPLTPDTRHLINAEAVAMMKDGVVLVNTSRGEIVNIDALMSGLRSRRIGSCAMDVVEGEAALFFDDHSGEILENEKISELLTFPNVLVTPHLAFCTDTALSNIWSTTVSNMAQYVNATAEPMTDLSKDFVNEIKLAA